jgi:hypothetical protein
VNIKNCYKKTIFLGFLLVFSAFALFGADFGLVLSGTPEYDSTKNPNEFSITGTATPWVQALLNPALNLYVSADLSLAYEDGKQQEFLPELSRTELSWRPAQTVFLQFGRQRFGDSAGLVTGGLFDGIHGALALGTARLSLGAFYTGLLYKERAEILLTAQDRADYGRALQYDDFVKTYFASRRVLVPVSLELSELTEQTSLTLNLIGQFDVNSNDSDNTFHSQYLEAHYFIEPANPLHLNIAAIVGIAESVTTQVSFAASAGADWELPTALQDLLSVRVRWASGAVNDTIGAFFPVSGISAGEIFTPRFSGVMHAQASYTARPHSSFSAEGGFGYFIRTDLETLSEGELDPAADSRALGGELYVSLVWAPQSAIRLTAGAGAFFPQMGGAFVSDAETRIKASFGAVISF